MINPEQYISCQKENLKALLNDRMPSPGFMPTEIDGVNLFRNETPYCMKPVINQPEIIILAQGSKRIHLGNRHYTVDSEHYFVMALTLPVQCEFLDTGEPLLGLVLRLDPVLIGKLLAEMDIPLQQSCPVSGSAFLSEISEEILDISVRLMKALNTGQETRILGPLYRKELLFKVLQSKNGCILNELVNQNRSLYHISHVLNNIHLNYHRPLEINDLAKEAGMSTSVFHSRFKKITNTSPLQYIKNYRLHKAKEMIQQKGEKVYEAALKVGYESPSQFNREYKRCFGITPAKDREANPVY